MLSKRETIRMVLEGQKPPYVPWSCGFTPEAKAKLQMHYGPIELENALDNHLLKIGSDIGFFNDLGDDCFQDVFGVVWDRSIDKDIGNVKEVTLKETTLKDYTFPDPLDSRFFADIPDRIAKYGDRFRVFLIGIGLNCFNPFQPEVMDVAALIKQYRGRLTFHGGLSTQRTLPFGSVADVRSEADRLLDMGRDGDYIFAPTHDVEGDVSLENTLAFIAIVQNQPGYRNE